MPDGPHDEESVSGLPLKLASARLDEAHRPTHMTSAVRHTDDANMTELAGSCCLRLMRNTTSQRRRFFSPGFSLLLNHIASNSLRRCIAAGPPGLDELRNTTTMEADPEPEGSVFFPTLCAIIVMDEVTNVPTSFIDHYWKSISSGAKS